MTKGNHRMFRATVLAASLACAMGWSSTMWAQTIQLKAPTGPGATLKTTPLTTQSPLTVSPAAQTNAVTSQSVLKTVETAQAGIATLDVVRVVSGASFSPTQKLAAAAAMFSAAASSEKDPQKKAMLLKASESKSMDAGVSLTLANPKAALGYLTFLHANVNFDKGDVSITPEKFDPKFGGVAAGVLCDFKRNGKQSGFYLMNFVVEIPTGNQAATKMKTLVGATGSTNGSVFSVSPGVRQILVPIDLSGYSNYVSLASDGYFIFKSCDISTVNSPA